MIKVSPLPGEHHSSQTTVVVGLTGTFSLLELRIILSFFWVCSPIFSIRDCAEGDLFDITSFAALYLVHWLERQADYIMKGSRSTFKIVYLLYEDTVFWISET